MRHVVTIQMLTSHFVGNSPQSHPVTIRTPREPPAPSVSIREEPQLGHVTVTWPAEDTKKETWESPTSYMVYVGVASSSPPNNTGVMHGRVGVNDLKRDPTGKMFEYPIRNLKIGDTYNVFVQVSATDMFSGFLW